ncbi:hypothetical protein EL26_10110 [Tumebacillus flagellatus]|uniref:YfjL-like N-terminal domain-containing protein n=1 Tax=Tumebacillus flagellatus TaxID=1157490 RepID=A0A074LMH8_9BACL|nr:hypothetical protein EL26_10110 [Tumebacillus flagellatus]
MKKRLWMLMTGSLAVLILAGGYCFFNGTPWGKYAFSKDVDHYLNDRYVMQQDSYTQTVLYSFKEGEYFSKIRLPNGSMFVVSPNYQHELDDTYYRLPVQ